MEGDGDSTDFNETRADLFEAISHPARIKILQALNEKPMGFAELGRAVGIEGGGHLGFHLRKLAHLVKTTPEGTYVLTGDGKEALWSINTLRKANGAATKVGDSSVRHRDWAKLIVPSLLIAVIILGGLGVYNLLPPRGAGSSGPTTTVTTSATSTLVSTLFIDTTPAATNTIPTCEGTSLITFEGNGSGSSNSSTFGTTKDAICVVATIGFHGSCSQGCGATLTWSLYEVGVVNPTCQGQVTTDDYSISFECFNILQGARYYLNALVDVPGGSFPGYWNVTLKEP